jgi:hypothetical protein
MYTTACAQHVTQPARAILGTANYVYVRTTRRSNTVNHPSCLVHSGWPHLATDPDRRRPRGRGSQRPQRTINMTRDMIGCSSQARQGTHGNLLLTIGIQWSTTKIDRISTGMYADRTACTVRTVHTVHEYCTVLCCMYRYRKIRWIPNQPRTAE